MKTTKLLIKTNHSKYSIFIGSKLISNLSEIIEKTQICLNLKLFKFICNFIKKQVQDKV